MTKIVKNQFSWNLFLGCTMLFLFAFVAVTPTFAGLGDLSDRINQDAIGTSTMENDSLPTAVVAPSFDTGSASSTGIGGALSGIMDSIKAIFGKMTSFVSSVSDTESSGGGIFDFFKKLFSGIMGGSDGSSNTANTDSGSTTASTDSGTTSTPTPPTASTASGSGGVALLGWLQQAGLTGEKLRMAWSISMGESSGNPRAYNGNSRTGDKSYGLFQINMIGSMGPARRREFGISSNEELFDPMTNIRAMLKVSNNGTNWRPWSVYKNGTYQRFYNQYPPR
jgi:hypothetical protein